MLAEQSGLEDAVKDTHPDDLRALGIELMGFGDQRGSFPGEHIVTRKPWGEGLCASTVRA